jgi:hypothetical protein
MGEERLAAGLNYINPRTLVGLLTQLFFTQSQLDTYRKLYNRKDVGLNLCLLTRVYDNELKVVFTTLLS